MKIRQSIHFFAQQKEPLNKQNSLTPYCSIYLIEQQGVRYIEQQGVSEFYIKSYIHCQITKKIKMQPGRRKKNIGKKTFTKSSVA